MGERGSKHSPHSWPSLLGGGAGEVWLSLLVQEGCDWSCGLHLSSLAQVMCVRCVHVYTVCLLHQWLYNIIIIPLTKTSVSIYMYVCSELTALCFNFVLIYI